MFAQVKEYIYRLYLKTIRAMRVCIKDGKECEGIFSSWRITCVAKRKQRTPVADCKNSAALKWMFNIGTNSRMYHLRDVPGRSVIEKPMRCI